MKAWAGLGNRVCRGHSVAESDPLAAWPENQDVARAFEFLKQVLDSTEDLAGR